MKIRAATKNDLKEIAELYEKIMQIQFKKVGEKIIDRKKYYSILLKNFNKSKMFVLEDENLVGFLWYLKEKDEISLEEIFVTKTKKGYGKILLNYLIKEAKKSKIKKINLDVHFKNKNAIEFFRKFGFSERTIEMSLEIKNA